MDLKYLQTFRTIVESGSFTKAAEELHYTQSTITFQVGQLERELSAQLFEKIGRKMVLTKAGEQLYPYVRDVLESVERMTGFENDVKNYRGSLKVGAAESLLCFKLPGVLEQFHREAPETKLYIQSMNCYDIRDALFEGSLDIGIFYQDIGGLGNLLETVQVGSYPLKLVASPDLAAQFPDFVTPDREIPVPFIINEKNCIFRQIFERYLKERSIRLDHTIELWSIPTIKNLVKSSMGISFLPAFTVEDEIASGELCEIPTDLSGTTITAVCGYHKNKWLSPAMRLFLEVIRQNA